MGNNYKQCVHCVLDTNDDQSISFDSAGVCNYCRDYKKRYVDDAPSRAQLDQGLKEILDKLKQEKVGKKYDSIIGLSGGVDSSYLAYKAKHLGLNPLLVHFDNGWNSELAVQNIERIINYTGFDLYTYVVDWEEFRELQLAYIRSGVLDWEIPTDHGFFATLYNQAYKNKIKYLLTGHNHQTEAILPKSMRWSKMDVANIKDINKKFGTGRIKTFPLLGFFKYIYYQKICKIERINILEYIDYNKTEAKEIIIRELGWRDYGGKHYESIFTRFYQGYVLLKKFGFDKRKAHLSNLICSNQITRDEALEELKKDPYDPVQLEEDKEYVIKKLRISPQEFDSIMSSAPVSHLEFDSYEKGLYINHRRFMEFISPLTRTIKKIFR